MTQREKLIRADVFARRVKNIAVSLHKDAKEYGVKFAAEYADDLEAIANNYLRLSNT